MKYFRNISWRFGEYAVRMILGLLVSIWVTRYLGPQKFGLLSYVQSFVALFTSLASLGLESVIIRELLKNPNKKNELMGTAFALSLVGSFFLLACIAAIMPLTSNDAYTNTLVFIVAAAPIFQSFNVIDYFLKSQVLSRYSAIINSSATVLSSILKIVLILAGASLELFAVVVLLESVFVAVGFVSLYFIKKTDFGFKKILYCKNIAINLLKDGLPLVLSGLFTAVYMRIDQVMIKEMMGAKDVGVYSVAVKLSELWNFFPVIVCSSLFPAIISAKAQNQDAYRKRLQNLYRLMTAVSLSIAIPMTFFGDRVIYILFGAEYMEAETVLTLYVWSCVFTFLGVAINYWLINEHLQFYMTVNTLLGAAANIILNYILIPKMGINGAALATLVSYAFSSYLGLLLWNKTRSHFWFIPKSLWPNPLKSS